MAENIVTNQIVNYCLPPILSVMFSSKNSAMSRRCIQSSTNSTNEKAHSNNQQWHPPSCSHPCRQLSSISHPLQPAISKANNDSLHNNMCDPSMPFESECAGTGPSLSMQCLLVRVLPGSQLRSQISYEYSNYLLYCRLGTLCTTTK